MDNLYELIYRYRLSDFQKKVENKDENGLGKRVCETEELLFAELNETQIKKVKNLELSIQDRLNEIELDIRAYLTNYAFQLGMETQRAMMEREFALMEGQPFTPKKE